MRIPSSCRSRRPPSPRSPARSAPKPLRLHADTWRAYLDPDGAEPDEDEQHRKRSFTLGRAGLDGMTAFRGLAPAEDAAVLRAARAACAAA